MPANAGKGKDESRHVTMTKPVETQRPVGVLDGPVEMLPSKVDPKKDPKARAAKKKSTQVKGWDDFEAKFGMGLMQRQTRRGIRQLFDLIRAARNRRGTKGMPGIRRARKPGFWPDGHGGFLAPGDIITADNPMAHNAPRDSYLDSFTPEEMAANHGRHLGTFTGGDANFEVYASGKEQASIAFTHDDADPNRPGAQVVSPFAILTLTDANLLHSMVEEIGQDIDTYREMDDEEIHDAYGDLSDYGSDDLLVDFVKGDANKGQIVWHVGMNKDGDLVIEPGGRTGEYGTFEPTDHWETSDHEELRQALDEARDKAIDFELDWNAPENQDPEPKSEEPNDVEPDADTDDTTPAAPEDPEDAADGGADEEMEGVHIGFDGHDSASVMDYDRGVTIDLSAAEVHQLLAIYDQMDAAPLPEQDAADSYHFGDQNRYEVDIDEDGLVTLWDTTDVNQSTEWEDWGSFQAAMLQLREGARWYLPDAKTLRERLGITVK